MEPLSFLAFGFMQRATLAGLFLGVLLASLGVFVTLRNMAFFGEGIAHGSLAGIALAVFAGLSPLPVAMGWAVILALLIFFLERRTRLSADSVLGILFTSSMALGVVIMNMTHGYQPELISFLFGSILSVSYFDLFIIIGCSLVILTWLFFSHRQLTLLSLSEEQATVAGVPVALQTVLFYIALALATVLGVKILGIILISALLIIPAATSRIFAENFRSHMIWSVVFSELIIFFGLAFSFYLNTPSGATIVLLGAIIFFLVAGKKLLQRP
ncbi:metal ABC transporter permease [Candidatus Uhrbacteria bacterium]|nr:metal ABC transporter permease [Candidatus Uhrbacteria bacterium]